MTTVEATTDDETIDFTPSSVHLVTLYARILGLLDRNPKMAQEKMARHLDVTMRTVQRHLELLEACGAFTVNRESKPRVYLIQRDTEIDGIQIGMLLRLMQ